MCSIIDTNLLIGVMFPMTAREAHKEQWDKLKDKPLRDKLKYIFTYYWATIFGVVCVIVFTVSWISSALSQKDAALSGYLLNGMTNSSYTGDLTQEFMEFQQIDSNEYTFKIHANTSYSSTEFSDTSVAVLESIVVQVAAGELDFIVTDLETYPILSAYFTDLRTVMTAEQLEKWKDNLVYVEKDALERLTSGELDTVELPQYFLSNEGLSDPLPLGIRLPDSSSLFDVYSFPPGDVIFGITRNAQNLSNTFAFLNYIFE